MMENRNVEAGQLPKTAAAALAARGELAARVLKLRARLTCCDLCPHQCKIDRLSGRTGRCRTGALARIASICDHSGEEPVLSGSKGAGTVFAAGCNLQCLYCQNHQISQGDVTAHPAYTSETLAEKFLELQQRGCHNLDWVSPTHVIPQFVEALAIAISRGLSLPVVYNTNGYERESTLELLDGIVDIYLPDFKYANTIVAGRLSGVSDYPDVAIAAIRTMFAQVGELVLDENGIARRGVIVRHLVLPGNLAGTRDSLRRLAKEVSPNLTVSLMAQYYPTHRATEIPELTRTITAAEYEEALDALAASGFENGWAQELASAPETYRPDFTEAHPFKRK